MATKLIITSACFLAVALSACATNQENPYYKYSSKYNTPTAGQATTTHANYNQPTTTYASTQTVSANGSMTNHKCLNKETNRELIGGAVGGTVGAIAGKKLIGGTKGTIAGAVLGGAAGYGIADKTIDCDPIPAQPASGHYGQNTSYQTTPVAAASITCPAGTIEQSNGTCMMGPETPVMTTPLTNATPAPTDTQYAGQELTGTPGYEAINGGAVEITEDNAQYAQLPDSDPGYDVTQTISGPIVMAGTANTIDYDYSQNIISANVPAAPVTAPETRIITSSPSMGSGYMGQNYTVVQGDTVYSLSRKLCVGVTDIQASNGLSSTYGIKIGQTLNLPASRC